MGVVLREDDVVRRDEEDGVRNEDALDCTASMCEALRAEMSKDDRRGSAGVRSGRLLL
jgi:hypothetical protein